MSLPIPAKGPKVTSLIWNGVDDLLVTGHDNGDIVQVCNNCWYKLPIPFIVPQISTVYLNWHI